jgi:hypothetical protein
VAAFSFIVAFSVGFVGSRFQAVSVCAVLLLPVLFLPARWWTTATPADTFGRLMLSVTPVVLVFWLMSLPNYGGATAWPRHMIWLTPLWLFAMPQGLGRLSRPGWILAAGALAWSVGTIVLHVRTAPYESPWLYRPPKSEFAGFTEPEHDDDGHAFRWTRADRGVVTIHDPGQLAGIVLRLRCNTAQSVMIRVNETVTQEVPCHTNWANHEILGQFAPRPTLELDLHARDRAGRIALSTVHIL